MRTTSTTVREAFQCSEIAKAFREAQGNHRTDRQGISALRAVADGTSRKQRGARVREITARATASTAQLPAPAPPPDPAPASPPSAPLQTAQTASAMQLASKSRRRLTGALGIPQRQWRRTREASNAHEVAPLVARQDSTPHLLAAAGTDRGAGTGRPAVKQISPPAIALPPIQSGQEAVGETQPKSPVPVSIAAHAESLLSPRGAPAAMPARIAAARKVSIQIGPSSGLQTAQLPPSPAAKADNKQPGSPVLAPVQRQHSAYMQSEANEDDALLAEAIALHKEQQAQAAAAQTGIVALARKSISGLSGRKGGKSFVRRVCCCL